MQMNRRAMLGAGAAAIAGLALPGAGAAQDGAGELLAGGGAVETPLGTIDFGLVVSADVDGKVAGELTLRDMTQPGNPTVLRSTQLNRLEPISADAPDGRQLIGWVTSGAESAIFVLRVEDLDGPGSGKDTFNLVVGEAAAPFLEGEEKSACDCADYSYSVKGTVVAGDILIAGGE
jgi:hypothetical protein